MHEKKNFLAHKSVTHTQRERKTRRFSADGGGDGGAIDCLCFSVSLPATEQRQTN